MKTNSSSKFCFFNSRALIAVAFSSASVLLAMLAFAANPPSGTTTPASPWLAHSRFGERAAAPKTANQAPTINGSWSIVPSPNNTTSDSLFSITCSSPSDCWTAGGEDSLIEHWDGASWTIASTNGTSTAQLYGVACASASACWAVGFDSSAGGTPVLEGWNGTSWNMVSAPNTSTTVLTAITCPGTSDCWAVGYDAFAPPQGIDQTVIDHWDGTTWTVVPSPNTSPNDLNFLAGVTCTSPSQCWAVGQYYDSNSAGYFKTLAEQWNGTSWTIVPSPNATANPQPSGQLFSVTCTSASGCWAVGEYTTLINGSYHSPTLIERWDGASWTIVASPNVNSIVNNSLNGVACLSASQCWAVGTLNNGGTSWAGPLLEQWDGTSWSIASWPGYALLYGVTCLGGSECWAVGWNGNGSGGATVIGHYPMLTPAFFTGEIPLSNGVYYLQFPNGNVFGYYAYLTNPRFIYHFDMGYEYWFDANDGHSGIFFYDFTSNHFFYTSPSFAFPYLYDFSLNTVLYYYPDPNRPGHYTTNPRYFYDFATGHIITM